MKKVTIAIILTFLFISSYSQSCLPNGIFFNTQAQIDSFQINYPGCTEIEGNVRISGYWISNLNGLNVLTSIGGYLDIFGNPNLSSMEGLEGLNSIGGSFYFNRNDSMTNMTGLEGLNSIGGDLEIWGNDVLSNMAGLESLIFIGGNIHISNSHDLINLQGLNGLTSIPGFLWIGGNFNLINLSGLENLANIGGNLRIRDNFHLANLTGLEALTSIGSYVEIEDHLSLTSLTGLEGLTSINGGLSIKDNQVLNNMTGLENLTTIGGGLTIGTEYHGNLSLTSLTGLDNVTSIGGGINIVDNTYLTSLTGLDNVTSIGGGIKIADNISLSSLEGLDNIDVGTIGNLEIFSNTSLNTCEALWLCNYLASPNGSVDIYNNASGCNNPSEIANSCGFTLPCLPFGNYYIFSQADVDSFSINYSGCTELEGNLVVRGEDITTLSGLSQITSIAGNLLIGDYSNGTVNGTSVSSMTGFEGLITIGGELDIYYNAQLTSLVELASLASIGGSLYIRGNDNLTSLSGLDNIDATSLSGLFIGGNNLLSYCHVESICAYLETSTAWAEIFGNANGCNFENEVLDSCEANAVNINEHHFKDNLRLYPNPTVQELNITVEGFTIDEVIIYSLTGQQVYAARPESETIDISTLQPGMYIVEVRIEERKVRQKLLVQR